MKVRHTFGAFFVGIVLSSHCHGNYVEQFFTDMKNENLVQDKITTKFEDFIAQGKLEIICDNDIAVVKSPPLTTSFPLKKEDINVYDPDRYCVFVFKKGKGVTFKDVVFLAQGLTQLRMFSLNAANKHHGIQVETKGESLKAWFQVQKDDAQGSERRQVKIFFKESPEYGQLPEYEAIVGAFNKEMGITDTVRFQICTVKLYQFARAHRPAQSCRFSSKYFRAKALFQVGSLDSQLFQK